jgi:hypothetical protein
MKFFNVYFKHFKVASKEVFSSKKSVIGIVILTFAFIFLNLIFREYLQIKRLLFENLNSFSDGIWYAWMSMPIISKMMMAVISLLSSILIVFVYLGFQKNQKLKGSAGSGGIVLGILAPACPSCGIGILSLLGFGSIGAFLPFGGREIGIVAIFILLGSLMYVSREIAEPRCKI